MGQDEDDEAAKEVIEIETKEACSGEDEIEEVENAEES